MKDVFSFEKMQTLAEVLTWRGKEYPDQIAVRFLDSGEEETAYLTYEDLHLRASRIAAKLRETLKDGDRVMLCYPPGINFVTAFVACLYARVTAVPIYPPGNQRGLQRLIAIVQDCSAALVLTDRKGEAKFKVSREENPQFGVMTVLSTEGMESGKGLPDSWQLPQPSELAFLQYTSGSTGTPKGVMVTHANLVANLRMSMEAMQIDKHTRMVSWLPVYHDMGLIGCVLLPLFAGFPTVLMPPAAFIEKPARWLKALSKYRGTFVGAPNFAYELCVRKVTAEEKAELDLSHMRVMVNGAEPVRAETLNRFLDYFSSCGLKKNTILPSYGLAEATLIVSGMLQEQTVRVLSLSRNALEQGRAEVIDGRDTKLAVSCGRPCTGQTIAIHDPETLEARTDGQVGEIWVASESVAVGYWNQPELSKDCFGLESSKFPGKKFLRTGDLGFLMQGELYVTGRLKDLLIVNGKNLYPQDIELTAEKAGLGIRPGHCVAFSIDSGKGEEAWLVAEVDRAALKQDLAKVAQSLLQVIGKEHEISLSRVYFLKPASLPKTSSGKLQRRRTCDQIRKQAIAPIYVWPEGVAGPLEVSVDEKPKEAPRPAPVAKIEAPTVSVPKLDAAHDKIVSQLCQWLAKSAELTVDKIDPAKPVASYGLDSLMAYELRCRIEENYGLSVPNGLLWDYPTLNAVADYLTKSLKKKVA